MDAARFAEILAMGEVQNIDFKGNERFEGDFQAHLATAIIAFANTAGGGTIVIGVDDGSHRVVGITEDDAKTFDPTKIANYLKDRVSTLPRFQLERHNDSAGLVLLIHVEEFSENPIIATKQIANSKKTFAHEGDILVRSTSCECRRIRSVEEMQELITRAVMKRSEQLLAQMKTILSGEKPRIPEESPEETFIKLFPEWQTKVNLFSKQYLDIAHWELQLLPVPQLTDMLDLRTIPELIQRSAIRWRGWSFPQAFDQENKGRYYQDRAEVQVQWRNHDEFWILGHQGAFGSISLVWQELEPQSPGFPYPLPPNRLISNRDICYTITEYFRFATNLTEILGYESLWIRIGLHNVHQRLLGEYDNPFFILDKKESSQPSIVLSGLFSNAELTSSWRSIAQQWTAQMYTVFQWPGVRVDYLESLQRDLESRQW